jgi:hypothetical protein
MSRVKASTENRFVLGIVTRIVAVFVGAGIPFSDI